MHTPDRADLSSRSAPQIRIDLSGVAKGRRHQQKARLDKFDQGNRPRPSARCIAVKVELIHRDLVDSSSSPVTKCEVGQDLSGTAHDRRVRVNRAVAGHQPNMFRAENSAEVKELLAHQRLDRRRVIRAFAESDGFRVRCQRNQGFSRSGRCVQDDVVACEDVKNCRLLMVIRGETGLVEPRVERFQDTISSASCAECTLQDGMGIDRCDVSHDPDQLQSATTRRRWVRGELTSIPGVGRPSSG